MHQKGGVDIGDGDIQLRAALEPESIRVRRCERRLMQQTREPVQKFLMSLRSA